MKTAEEILESKVGSNDDWNMASSYMKSSVEEAMEAYADQFKPKWIDIKDRYPSFEPFTNIELLTVWDNAESDVTLFEVDEFGKGDFVVYDHCKLISDPEHRTVVTEDITHWMHKPELPK